MTTGRIAWLGAAFLAALAFISTINVLPTKNEAAIAAWAQVQNQYQRRADLVPNLVEVVKGYAGHENKTLVAVTEARASATSIKLSEASLSDPKAVAAFELAQANLKASVVALGRMVTEQYPNLKANRQFENLMVSIEGTENRISTARMDYIKVAQDFNTTINTIPHRIYNSLIYQYPRRYDVTANEAAQTAPAAKF